MSTGTRLPLSMAQDAARALMTLWNMPADSCMVVGSVRRGAAEVGDLEFTARMPVDKGRDDLYRAMSGTLKTDGLFRDEAKRRTFGVAVEGFKPGFKYCSVQMTMVREHDAFDIGVQIHRYAHGDSNRGWIEIMRTGPAEFGPIFLSRWKKQHGIPMDKPASIDGFLVNALGERISVPTEAEAFRLCALQYIEPSRRDAICEHLRRAGGAG